MIDHFEQEKCVSNPPTPPLHSPLFGRLLKLKSQTWCNRYIGSQMVSLKLRSALTAGPASLELTAWSRSR